MRLFSIDYRSLALFRMALGLALLYSLTTFATVANMFFASDGVLSPRAMQDYYRGTWTWSVNWLSDSTWFQYAVLLLAAAAAVSLFLGWRTRLSTVTAWVLFSSINMRVTPILGGGDVLLNLLLFWSMFLPLGAHWSLDARRQGEPEDAYHLSMGTVAILLQMAMMYFFTGISKFNDIWLGGRALDIALSVDRATRPLGHVLAGYPWLTSLITRSTLVAELTLPFVLFSPWKSNWCRSIALLMLMVFHVGIEATMVVVMFSCASLAGLVLFVPPVWWQYPPLKHLQGLLDKLFSVRSDWPPAKRGKNAKRLSSASRERGSFDLKRGLAGTAIACCLLYVLTYNLIVGFATPDMRRRLGTFQRWGELLVLKQYWDMFCDPSPNCNEIACVAHLRDGTQIDLLRDNLKVSDPHEFPSQPAHYDRFRKTVFASVIAYPNYKRFQGDLVEYLCRQYSGHNSDHSKEIVYCTLMYYPYGPHAYAKRASYIELIRAKPHG